MPLLINLRHLDADNVRLEGEILAEELDIDTRDQIIQAKHPLVYGLEVQKLEEGLLLKGRLALTLTCQCVRCLKRFERALIIDPWTAHLPLVGEEAVRVVNDCVDVLQVMREDILLDFPQHPVCNPACRGLPKASPGTAPIPSGPGVGEPGSAAWAELDKLKL